MVIGSGAVLVYLGTFYLIEGARLKYRNMENLPKIDSTTLSIQLFHIQTTTTRS